MVQRARKGHARKGTYKGTPVARLIDVIWCGEDGRAESAVLDGVSVCGQYQQWSYEIPDD